VQDAEALEAVTLENEKRILANLATQLGKTESWGVLSNCKIENNKVLDWCKQELSGNIPLEIGTLSQLPALEELRFGRNNLDGLIPKEIFQLINLTTLDLSNNQFDGVIPKEICKLTNLSTLDLGHNKLDGSIPKEIGKLTNLETLFLDRNKLDGGVPIELTSLNKLASLVLSGNKLSGEMPDIFPADSKKVEEYFARLVLEKKRSDDLLVAELAKKSKKYKSSNESDAVINKSFIIEDRLLWCPELTLTPSPSN